MKGIGGPLLCIGDLLSDVGEGSQETAPPSPRTSSPSTSSSISPTSDFDSPNPDLTQIFQANYEQLLEALAGSDHSWTALTLKLCSALETANQLVSFTNSNATALSEKVAELERMLKKADSAVDAAKVAQAFINQKAGPAIADQST